MRKRILTTLALLAAPLAFASIVVLFNPTTNKQPGPDHSKRRHAAISRSHLTHSSIQSSQQTLGTVLYVTNGADHELDAGANT